MKFYGPYLRENNKSVNNLWHWHKECPDFPVNLKSESMVSTSTPSPEELCKKCLIIEGIAIHDGYHQSSVVPDNHNSIYSENKNEITSEDHLNMRSDDQRNNISG